MFSLLIAFLAAAYALPITSDLKPRDSLSAIRNDLLLGPCKPVTVIFARGTGEAGNVGLLVGPELFNSLGDLIGDGNVAAQGVEYPADPAGYYIGGSPIGATDLANLVNLAASKCPNTKIVLGGYSQGAQVVHLGVAQISGAASQIKAVVLFGDPYNGQPLPNIPNNKVKTFCKPDDSICQNAPIPTLAHLTYDTDIPTAAQFIQSELN